MNGQESCVKNFTVSNYEIVVSIYFGIITCHEKLMALSIVSTGSSNS